MIAIIHRNNKTMVIVAIMKTIMISTKKKIIIRIMPFLSRLITWRKMMKTSLILQGPKRKARMVKLNRSKAINNKMKIHLMNQLMK